MTSYHWADDVNLYQHHQKSAVLILSNLALICISCVNGVVITSTYRYAFSCLYIWLLYMSILNNIESHNVINKNLWNRYVVGSAPIMLAQHWAVVSRAYLFHAIVSPMTSFASCINHCMFTNDYLKPQTRLWWLSSTTSNVVCHDTVQIWMWIIFDMKIWT